MESYPRISVNFRKLEVESLVKVLKHYGVTPVADKSQEELALLAARTFEAHKLIETDIVDKFVGKYCKSTADASGSSNRKRMRTQSFYREQLDSEPARSGEQVAAKVLATNENGSWILANTLDFDVASQIYELQDEDDTNRTMQLGFAEVKRLEDSAAHLRRGDLVLAVFPETTSFYRAEVVKNPRHPQHGNSCWEVIVRFEDDEDESGKAPPRRVPARFVLLRSDVGDYDEEDGVVDGAGAGAGGASAADAAPDAAAAAAAASEPMVEA